MTVDEFSNRTDPFLTAASKAFLISVCTHRYAKSNVTALNNPKAVGATSWPVK